MHRTTNDPRHSLKLEKQHHYNPLCSLDLVFHPLTLSPSASYQVVWYCGGCNQEVDDSTDDATEHDPEIEFDCQTDINFDHDDGVDFDHGHDRDHDYHNHDYHEVETDLDDMMVTDHDRYMLASAAEAAAAACELQTLPVTCV